MNWVISRIQSGLFFIKMIELNRKRDLNICCIYKIVFPNGKIYIGQTTNLYRRSIMHKNAIYSGQKLLQQAFLDCGSQQNKTILKVLHYCNKKELNKWEKYYIIFYNTADSLKGLNLELGGCNGKASKRSKLNKGLAGKGRKYSKNGLKNIIKALRKRAKPLLQYDLNGNFIKEWETTGDVAKAFNLKRKSTGNIHAGCKSGKPRLGFIWKYK